MRKLIVGLVSFFITCGMCISAQRVIKPTDQVKSMVDKVNSNFKEIYYNISSAGVGGDVSGELKNLQLKPGIVVASDINISNLLTVLTNSLLSTAGGSMTNQYGVRIAFSVYPGASIVLDDVGGSGGAIMLNTEETAPGMINIINKYEGMRGISMTLAGGYQDALFISNSLVLPAGPPEFLEEYQNTFALFVSTGGLEYAFNNSRLDMGSNDLVNVANAYIQNAVISTASITRAYVTNEYITNEYVTNSYMRNAYITNASAVTLNVSSNLSVINTNSIAEYFTLIAGTPYENYKFYRTGTLNGRPRFYHDNSPTSSADIYWDGTQWVAIFESLTTYNYSAAYVNSGDTQIPPVSGWVGGATYDPFNSWSVGWDGNLTMANYTYETLPSVIITNFGSTNAVVVIGTTSNSTLSSFLDLNYGTNNEYTVDSDKFDVHGNVITNIGSAHTTNAVISKRLVIGSADIADIADSAVGSYLSGEFTGANSIYYSSRGASQQGYFTGNSAIGHTGHGSQQLGYFTGDNAIGYMAYGASQRGYFTGNTAPYVNIGAQAHGSEQRGFFSGVANISSADFGSSQIGRFEGKASIEQSGAQQLGVLDATSTATNRARGAIQVMGGNANEVYTTENTAVGSLLVGPGIQTNEYGILARGHIETKLGFIGDGSQLTNILATYGPFNINSFAAHSVYNPQTTPVNYARVPGLSSQPLTTNPNAYNSFVYQNNGGVVHPRLVFGIGVNYKVVMHVRVDNPTGNGLYTTLTKVSPLYTNPGGQIMIPGLVDRHMGTAIFSTFESDTLNTTDDNAEGFWFRVHFACDAGGNGALIRDTTVYIQRVP